MKVKSLSEEHVSLDAFLGGKLKLYQPKEGYRFSIDSLLLANFIASKDNDRVIDLGTGCGIIPLLLYCTKKFSSILGVEIQKELAALARKNIAINGAESRIEIIEEDFRHFASCYDGEKFSIVISNPPYRKLNSGRLNPRQEKAIARHEISCTLEELIAATTKLLSPKGRFYFIYPAHRLAEILTWLRRFLLSARRIAFIHPQAGRQATHFLIEGAFISPLNLTILPPFFIFNPDGSYTAQIEKILLNKK